MTTALLDLEIEKMFSFLENWIYWPEWGIKQSKFNQFAVVDCIVYVSQQRIDFLLGERDYTED